LVIPSSEALGLDPPASAALMFATQAVKKAKAIALPCRYKQYLKLRGNTHEI
jgi:hypothetical protein